MSNRWDQIIHRIDQLVGDTSMPLEETIDALENIRDHVEPWIDVLRHDLENQ